MAFISENIIATEAKLLIKENEESNPSGAIDRVLKNMNLKSEDLSTESYERITKSVEQYLSDAEPSAPKATEPQRNIQETTTAMVEPEATNEIESATQKKSKRTNANT
jgi:hypothetical protein